MCLSKITEEKRLNLKITIKVIVTDIQELLTRLNVRF